MPISAITVTIPTDYPTLQAAVDALSVDTSTFGRPINLRIATGHQLAAGLLVQQGDYSRFKIVAQADGSTPGSAVVQCASNFQGVSDIGLGIDANGKTGNLIAGFNAAMPVLACRISMQNVATTANSSQTGSGYYAIWGCTGMVLQNCGVIYAGFNGLEMRASKCTATNTNFSNARNSSFRVAHSSELAMQGAKGNDSCTAPESANNGTLDISRGSKVFARQAELDRSGANGINCRRNSQVVFEEASIRDAQSDGVDIGDGSTFSGYSAIITGTIGQTAVVDGKTVTLGAGLRVATGASGTVAAATIVRAATNTIGKDILLGKVGGTTGSNAAGEIDVTDVVTTAGTNQVGDTQVERFNTLNRRGTLKNSNVTAGVTWGAGAPNGSVTAPPGSIYVNLSGGVGATLHVKESGSGNTGWDAK